MAARMVTTGIAAINEKVVLINFCQALGGIMINFSEEIKNQNSTFPHFFRKFDNILRL